MNTSNVGTLSRTRSITRSIWSIQARGPGAAALAGQALAVAGAALILASAAIHLHLWATGYKHIATVGPLFLAQGVGSIPFALALIALRRRVVLMVAGAALMVATAFGLLLSTWAGLFGYHESLAVPYAGMSLVVEFGGAGVLLLGAGLVLASGRRG